MSVVVTVERIPSRDARLKRVIRRDPRNLRYLHKAKAAGAGATIVSVRHARSISVLDQGQLGSCTGNAAIGALATAPLVAAYNAVVAATPTTYTLNEPGAVRVYSAAEVLDGGAGYPPEDEGSSGQSVAEVLRRARLISGYTHCLTLQDTLSALQAGPLLFGTNWYDGMFTPATDGRVRPTGSVAGGHEVELFGVDVAQQQLWFYNSWGASWGLNGTFYLTYADFSRLLAEQGDIVAMQPASAPSPSPSTPSTPAAYTAADKTFSDQVKVVMASGSTTGARAPTLVSQLRKAYTTWAATHGNFQAGGATAK
jgi:hypothetical protein